MPPNQQFDISIDGRGFMLARGRNTGRAWRRTSAPSIPGGSSPDEARFSTTAPNLRFKEVFDDFSGGDGFAYRAVAPANGIHWSENFDNRWAGQAVHCQALKIAAPQNTVTTPVGVVRLGDFPPQAATQVAGKGSVVALTASAAVGFDLHIFEPTGYGTEGSALFGSEIQHQGFEGRPATFGSFHYFGVAGDANFLQVARDLTSTVVSALPGAGFANGGSRLWRYHGPPRTAHYVQSVAAEASVLAAASWSATLSVGNGINGINDMIGLRENVFCGLADGLYQVDQSGTAINVTGELAGRAHPENFRDLDVHNGEVVGVHVAGLFAYNPTTTTGKKLRRIDAPQRSARSPIVGQYRAVKSYGGWLYAGLWSGSASYVRAGYEAGPDDWRWFTLHRLPHPSMVNRLHFDGLTMNQGATQSIPNRFWVATDASFGIGGLGGSAPLYYSPSPRNNANPLALDTTFSANYAGSARLVLPLIDRGAPGVAKIGEAVELWADGFLSGSRYADVYYAVDRGARTLLGRAQTSPVSTLLMGSTNGSFPTFRSIELDIESFNTTPGTCQVYRSVVLTGNLRPDYVETIEAVIAIADDMPDRRGTPMRPASVQIDDLRDLAAPLRHGNIPHQLLDLAGATSYVVMDGMPVESETYQEGSENPELTASITMVVLTLSQNTQ